MNLKYIILVVLMVCTLTNCSHTTQQQNQSTVTIDKLELIATKQPPKELLDLLEHCAIKHNGSITDIIEKTQHAWLRKPSIERWQYDLPEKISLSIALPHFEKLGMLQEVIPSHMVYDYALILGATTNRVRNRLAYLVHLWQQGIRFKIIVLLGSKRPLDPTADSTAMLNNIPQQGLPTRKNWQAPTPLPTTECAMMRMIFDQVEMPDEIKKCLRMIVNSPQIKMPNGITRRATTADTIIDWLKQNPHPGSCLFISNQPYVGYQHTVVQVLLPKSFTIDTVGTGVKNSSTLDANVCLDMLARWLYQKYKKTPKCLY
jgi:hypothetical protein